MPTGTEGDPMTSAPEPDHRALLADLVRALGEAADSPMSLTRIGVTVHSAVRGQPDQADEPPEATRIRRAYARAVAALGETTEIDLATAELAFREWLSSKADGEIVGFTMAGCNCPVANWLESVRPAGWTVTPLAVWPADTGEVLFTPPWLEEIICRVDDSRDGIVPVTALGLRRLLPTPTPAPDGD